MKELNLNFSYKARYYKLGEIENRTGQVWFVIHGYGQLGQYFINKFKVLAEKGVCIIAPEGLSRFYLEDMQTRIAGGSNRVGATWMTRENREMDIENYINYLQSIYDHEVGSIKEKIKVTILGFSQGAATATRWILHDKIDFKQFILWAGIFPNDMNFEKGKEVFNKKKVIRVFGTDDPFVTPPRVEEMEILTDKLNLSPEKISFEGKHELNDDLLLKLAGF